MMIREGGDVLRQSVLFVALLAMLLGVLVIFTDWVAGRGIFYYQNQTYQADRAAQRYCDAILGTSIKKIEPGPETKADYDPDGEQKKHDSCQQWRSAQAAEKAAGWAGHQAVSSWIGVIFLFLTTVIASLAAAYAKSAADAGDRAAREAERGAIETKRAADAAVAAVAQEREFGFRQLRAYVVATDASIRDLVVGKTPQVKLELTNCGQTPARNFVGTFAAGIIPMQALTHSLPVPPPPTVLSSCAIGGGKPHYMSVFVTRKLTPEQMDGLQNGTQVVHAFCIGTYEDLEGIQRTVQANYVYGGLYGMNVNGAMYHGPDNNNFT